MPGDSEHPVTVEDLYVVQSFNDIRSATVADLVSALRAVGVLRPWHIEHANKVTYDYRVWSEEEDDPWAQLADGIYLLVALAEAQPFPPAGGVS